VTLSLAGLWVWDLSGAVLVVCVCEYVAEYVSMWLSM
jgi:hypothetical protein